MLLVLSTSDLAAALPFVIDPLENEVIYGNRLADAARVGVSPDEDATEFRVVYPNCEAVEGLLGVFSRPGAGIHDRPLSGNLSHNEQSSLGLLTVSGSSA